MDRHTFKAGAGRASRPAPVEGDATPQAVDKPVENGKKTKKAKAKRQAESAKE